MWNMQSGIRRRTFQLGPCPPDVANRIHGTNSEKQKERAVTGLATDPLNTTLVACTMDGTVNVCSFSFQWITAFTSRSTVLRLQIRKP